MIHFVHGDLGDDITVWHPDVKAAANRIATFRLSAIRSFANAWPFATAKVYAIPRSKTDDKDMLLQGYVWEGPETYWVAMKLALKNPIEYQS